MVSKLTDSPFLTPDGCLCCVDDSVAINCSADALHYRTLGVVASKRGDGVTLDDGLAGAISKSRAFQSGPVNAAAEAAARAFASGDDSGYDRETNTLHLGAITISAAPSDLAGVRRLVARAVRVSDERDPQPQTPTEIPASEAIADLGK